MTTETLDATQTDAPETSTNAPVELSARDKAYAAMEDHRMAEFEAENRGEQLPIKKPGSEEETLSDQLSAQLEDKAPVNIDDQLVRVKIDGVESEVSVAEMRRQFQKNGAAERRLEEATRLLQEAKAAQQTPPEPLRFVQDDKKPDSDADDEGKALLAALFEGDESKALEGLKKLGIGRGKEAPTLNVEQIAAQITPAIRQQLFVESALEQFSMDFKDIVADPYLADLADTFLDAEVASGKPYDEALKQAGQKTRDWLASKGVKTTEANPTIDRNTKLERKAGIDKIPALNSKATTVETPEPSQSDLIREARKARGLDS